MKKNDLKIDDNKRYNLHPMLTYNCLFNFLLGERSVGKTFACKKFAINQFLNHGYQFIYLRRFDKELDEIHTFFDDIKFLFPDEEFEVKGRDFYINGELAGFATDLLKGNDLRSVPLPNVWLIIFDEFLFKEGNGRYYLKGEVTMFLDVYVSVDRYRGVKVIFIANTISFNNPYFIYFKIRMPYNSNFQRKGDILIEISRNKSFREEVEKTRLGQIIKDTPYGNYVINNEFDFDTDKEFIIKNKGQNCKYLFTLITANDTLGVWADYDNGYYHVNQSVQKNCNFKYSLQLKNHKVNTLLINNKKENHLLHNFIKMFKNGDVRFENIKIKNIMYNEILPMLI